MANERPTRPDAIKSDLTSGLTAAHQNMGAEEAMFHRVVHYNAGVLWELGAVDATLAALWDVVLKAAGPQGLRAALQARPGASGG
jgi:hypothetical protein